MGDEQPAHHQAQLIDASSNRQSDNSAFPSQSMIGPEHSQAQDMEFAPYQRQQHGSAQPGPPTLDMNSLANALPDYQYRQYPQVQPFQQQMLLPAANSSMLYQFHQGAQFAGQTANNYNQSFIPHYTPPYHQNRSGHVPYAALPTGAPGAGPQQSYANPNYYIQQQVVPHGGNNFQSQAQQMVHAQTYQQPRQGAPYGSRAAGMYQLPQLRVESYGIGGPPLYSQPVVPALRRNSSSSSLQAVSFRGPPRKPKQSGHALWVGNLPPGANIVDLKDHFSREATDDIESVFLISKSNCAFVNYKSEASCTAAMNRFHDSRFQGVRLVCRLRRGNAPSSTAPSPASGASAVFPSTDVISPEAASGSVEQLTEKEEVQTEETTTEETIPAVAKVKEKFFLVKSLTIEDLERSVHSGVWATQAHNETALNKAYQSAENVYLIFSANKSGEYFGYARMDSAIDDEAAASIEQPTRVELPSPGPSDLPVTIPTPSTATAPKGHIIDDSARGTIFWEAEQAVEESNEDQSKLEEPGNLSGEESAVSMSGSPGTPQAFGKPFKIVWMSTDRLPFYRTRGLRNPWNANREVKIARDGTELEPSVGRRLVAMFARTSLAASPAASRGTYHYQQAPAQQQRQHQQHQQHQSPNPAYGPSQGQVPGMNLGWSGPY